MLLTIIILFFIGCNVKYKRNYRDWENRMNKEEMKKHNEKIQQLKK
jgi:hypothetical protein